MSSEVKVPTLGESVSEATIGEWLKKPGDAVKADEPIASLETDKVAVEVLAPVSGIMREQKAAEGETVEVGALIAIIEEGAVRLPQRVARETKSSPEPQRGRTAPRSLRATAMRPRFLRRCAARFWNTVSIRRRFKAPARTDA